MNKEDVIRRCRAILSMAKGGTEHEMMNAAKLLQRLLLKHELSLADIEDKTADVDAVESERISGKYNETWRRTCFAAAAKLFMCGYHFETQPWDKNARVIHVVSGLPHNVAVAVEMAQYFEATISRLANEATRSADIEKDAHTTRHQFIRAFRLTAANRVYSRVLEYINLGKQGLLEDESGECLPSTLTIYQQAESLIQEWYTSQGYEISTHNSRDQIKNREASRLGRAAGDSISFNSQVTAGKSSGYALPSH